VPIWTIHNNYLKKIFTFTQPFATVTASVYLLRVDSLHISGHADDPSHESALPALLEGCRRNDRACQEKLYRRYAGTMMDTVRRYTGDRETALHILNNGFLKAFQRIEQYAHQGSFDGWLRKIMTNTVAEHFRSNRHNANVVITSELPEHITK
jgi:RNA polymerase sigma-70 factor (ECF subfamily)